MKLIVDQCDKFASGVVGSCGIDIVESVGEGFDAVLEMA